MTTSDLQNAEIWVYISYDEHNPMEAHAQITRIAAVARAAMPTRQLMNCPLTKPLRAGAMVKFPDQPSGAVDTGGTDQLVSQLRRHLFWNLFDVSIDWWQHLLALVG